MVAIEFSESIFARLKEIVQYEERDIVEVIETMIEQYKPKDAPKRVDWSLILDISDADIS